MSLSQSERVLRARVAAFSQHAQGKTNTGPARLAFLGRFETQVDPDRKLQPAERIKRSGQARKAYFTALALKSAKARREAKSK